MPTRSEEREKRRRRKGIFLVLIILIVSVLIIGSLFSSKLVGLLFKEEAEPLLEEGRRNSLQEDTKPPIIEGAKNQKVYMEEKISYKKGVTVTDNRDEDAELVVDSSAVNLKKEGSYPVVYKVTDSSGNIATKTITLEVQKKPDGSINQEELDEVADEILATIITQDMSQKEKAEEIYQWIRGNIGYINHSDKSDWVKAAYQGIQKRKGDCFNYYAVARELLTRAGIENKSIKEIVEGHYWNMINLGNGWYHFDTTPRVGEGDYFFMWTDAQLEEYSRKHDNSHLWDREKYPATPLE